MYLKNTDCISQHASARTAAGGGGDVDTNDCWPLLSQEVYY